MQKGSKTYIRDTSPMQRVPTIKEIKPKKDESIQHEQVVQKPIPKGSKPKRKGRPKGGKK